MAFDPYAPPTSTIEGTPLGVTGGVYRQGKVLVVERDSGDALPDYCVKCGEPAEGFRLRKKLQWHPPWVYFLFLFNVLFYAIGALVTRKSMAVAVPLCPQHRGRRSGLMLGSAGVMALCVLGCGGGLAIEGDAGAAVVLLASVVGFVGLIVLLAVQAPLRAQRIDEAQGRFLGAKDSFLDRLPSGL